jgi:hypothetical protein
MSPFIKDGDVITVVPVPPSNSNPHVPTSFPAPPSAKPVVKTCGIGQVVAFVSPVNQRLVVHRVVGRHDVGFLILGDNQLGPGAEAVRPDDILGRVARIERGTKRVWLGLGPERHAIAILSRAGLLLPFVLRASVLTRLLGKRDNEGN